MATYFIRTEKRKYAIYGVFSVRNDEGIETDLETSKPCNTIFSALDEIRNWLDDVHFYRDFEVVFKGDF